MADHLELVAEIPKVEKLSVQDRLELARKRRSQQLKRWERDKDKEFGPPPPKKKPLRARPVKFEPRIILLEAASRGDVEEGLCDKVLAPFRGVYLSNGSFVLRLLTHNWSFNYLCFLSSEKDARLWG